MKTDTSTAIRLVLQSTLSGARPADAMNSLIVETSKLKLKKMDEWERVVREELWSIERAPPSPKWKFWKSEVHPAPWLEICSSNGFTRERALQKISGAAPNAFFLVLAARRLNDWVPQVRASARAKLPLIAAQSPPALVADALCSILSNSTSWGRMESQDRGVLVDLISIKPVALAIKDRIVEASAGPLTSIFAQASRVDALDEWLDVIANNAIQPSVRARAFRYQLEQRATWIVGRKWVWTDLKWCKGEFEPVVEQRSILIRTALSETLNKASHDSSPMVRRIAGEFLIKHLESLGTESVKIANRLALDSSPYVSERGRFALARLDLKNQAVDECAT